jgi:CheY-like chemotaxis protein
MAAEPAPDPPLRTLIADDEPLAIERMQILCAQTPGIDLVGTASDGEAALRLVDALKPDLLLLDIAMPGLDGMGVAQALARQETSPAVIFCTAFDQFAVAAFDIAAVDYLLKPVSPERLSRAVGRAGAVIRTGAGPAKTSSRWTEEFWVPWRSSPRATSIALMRNAIICGSTSTADRCCSTRRSANWNGGWIPSCSSGSTDRRSCAAIASPGLAMTAWACGMPIWRTARRSASAAPISPPPAPSRADSVYKKRHRTSRWRWFYDPEVHSRPSCPRTRASRFF